MRTILILLTFLVTHSVFGQTWYQLQTADPFPGTRGAVYGIEDVAGDFLVTGKFDKEGMTGVAVIPPGKDTLVPYGEHSIPGAEDERVIRLIDRMGATYAITESGVFRHYSTGWESLFPDNWVLNYSITSAIKWNENIFVGGHFTEFLQFGAPQRSVSHCFFYNGDSIVEAPMPETVRDFTLIDDTLYAFALQEVYQWNGQEWSIVSWIENMQPPVPVYRFWGMVRCNGEIYLSGKFEEVARVMTRDSVEIGQFREEDPGDVGKIRDMMCHRDTLYVTGHFKYAIKNGNGVEAPGVAYLAPGDDSWSSLGSGLIDQEGKRQAGAVLGKRGSSIYVGGSFNRIDSTWFGSIARWGPGTLVDTTGDTTNTDTTDTTGVGVLLDRGIAFSLFPNPADNHFFIDFNEKVVLERITLYDIAGRKQRQIPLSDTGPQTRFRVPVKGIAPGVYILRLRHDGQTKSLRVVIE